MIISTRFVAACYNFSCLLLLLLLFVLHVFFNVLFLYFRSFFFEKWGNTRNNLICYKYTQVLKKCGSSSIIGRKEALCLLFLSDSVNLAGKRFKSFYVILPILFSSFFPSIFLFHALSLSLTYSAYICVCWSDKEKNKLALGEFLIKEMVSFFPPYF